MQHLQAAGHVTGTTGDGVDAPALRQAEVGIAVSTATDVAKGAASVVLTEAGLTNIVALVEQGRTIYQRILTWIINKISRTLLKAAFVAIAFVVTGKFVVSAFAMLLRLKAELPRYPLRGGPHREEHDRKDGEDLPPENSGRGHGNQVQVRPTVIDNRQVVSVVRGAAAGYNSDRSTRLTAESLRTGRGITNQTHAATWATRLRAKAV